MATSFFSRSVITGIFMALASAASLANMPARDGSVLPVLEQQMLVANRADAESTIQRRLAMVSSDSLASSPSQLQSVEQMDGTTPLLVLRVGFDDQPLRYDASEWQRRIFDQRVGVSAYFHQNSYGQMQLVSAADGVIDVQLDGQHPDFGAAASANGARLAQRALTAAYESGALTDLAEFDANADGKLSSNELAILIVVAGYEQAYAGNATSHPRIWAHQTGLGFFRLDGVQLADYAMVAEQHEEHMATLGIIAHELGHLLLGLPDLNNASGIASGVGRWGLMGLGGWNGDEEPGDSPAHLLAWSKARAGFLNPRSVSAGVSDWQLSSSSVSADALEIPADEYQHGERVIVEYRTPQGFDHSLPQRRLLVTHVDDRMQTVSGSSPLASAPVQTSLVLNEVDYAVQDAITDQSVYTLDGGELLAVVTGTATADSAALSVERFQDTGGRHLGFDQRLATDFRVPAIGEQWVMLLDDDRLADAITVDGTDIYAAAGGNLTVELVELASAGDWRSATSLFRDNLILEAGWNRILFGETDLASVQGQLALVLSDDSGAPVTLGADTVAAASGQWLVRKNSEIVVQDSDLNVKILYRVDVDTQIIERESETPASDAEEAPVGTAVAGSASDDSGSGSSGGGSGWWLVFLASGLVMMRRIR